MIPTCTHLYDSGGICNSAASSGQKYCVYHLRYRARQLRMAQYRARAERFRIKLPPLESLCAVQSALSEIAEALAADMIDPKRAQALLSVLRLASLNLRHPEKWQNNPYHSDQPSQFDPAQEFGLPRELDLDTPPDTAFPRSEAVGSPPLSAASADDRVGGWPSPPSVGGVGVFGGTASSTTGSGADNQPLTTRNLNFGPNHPISPEWLELRDIHNHQGDDAEKLRFRQLERNRTRRELRANRQRYTDLAMKLNVKWAAEQLADSKLAEKLREAGIAPAGDEPQDFDARVAAMEKKVAADTTEIDACLAGMEVKIA